MPPKTKKAWIGRFTKPSHPLLEKFNASLSFDKRLSIEDIAGSLAHARMLKKIGVLTAGEWKKIEGGLTRIVQEIEGGAFKFSDRMEDIHMAVEARLTQMIGPVGGKLHTARSRNDQVALDLRLYTRRYIDILTKQIRNLQSALVDLAAKRGMVPMPGYTHLQRAQPVYFAHHLLAYFEMLERDQQRLHDARRRVNISPLGSGAIAGTTFPLDREFVARQLGMDGVTHNSIDGVSDRDFAVEVLFALSLMMTHLSRFCEELILWASQEFQFVALPEDFCTGSSMMPQKVNPDVPELIRGKTGRVYGDLIALLTVLKGLPLAYNKDLQEDKEPLFDALDTAHDVLEVLSAMVPGIQPRPDHMKQATVDGFLLATEVADYLASHGMPFRLAHETSGKMVRHCIAKKKTLDQLTINELKQFSVLFSDDFKKWVDLKSAMDRRKVIGGTGEAPVKKELARARRLLKAP